MSRPKIPIQEQKLNEDRDKLSSILSEVMDIDTGTELGPVKDHLDQAWQSEGSERVNFAGNLQSYQNKIDLVVTNAITAVQDAFNQEPRTITVTVWVEE